MLETASRMLVVALISGLAGCMAPTKDELLPQDGPTMEEVYRNHIQKGQGDSDGKGNHIGIKERVMRSGDIDLDGYTRSANNEIQATFPRLPNPTLVMYVYPHISTSSQLPVPGYSTAFPLYERPQYALPGEM